ncbi:hypothetical protein IQ230_13835 [Gloeocapsopsis crepidinum LEGE 06123]|uniref:YkuD domain-containing protein n=1 Tax=Gloeocapsopsis crepidinum LEGE 06123 TaxID=588587 RepID=A0ABR9USZ3_9CHRO|nr:hypothetical protein [Gloeocapsopsis crepidinum]MBE9191407.1 hypothetical protein [Gloeocapsopsis crepidinum LEGE 06123]
MNPSIEFHLSLPLASTKALAKGFLLLKSNSSRAGIRLQATSGCSGFQYSGSWKLKGRGPLPPSKAIEPTTWSVSTQRLWLPHVKGVEGSFYAIAPFSVRVDEKTTRGDFGIHFDANVPGSAGCIVLPIQDHWDVFRKWMADLAHQKIQQVPLSVVYTAPMKAKEAA